MDSFQKENERKMLGQKRSHQQQSSTTKATPKTVQRNSQSSTTQIKKEKKVEKPVAHESSQKVTKTVKKLVS